MYFHSKKKCRCFNQNSPIHILSDHCMAPKKVGPCRGSFPRWHYNAASQKCEQFIFGGCRENRNNYLLEEECKFACSGSHSTGIYWSFYFHYFIHLWFFFYNIQKLAMLNLFVFSFYFFSRSIYLTNLLVIICYFVII